MGHSWKEQFHHTRQVWTQQAYPAYHLAYNLNNHPRGILAAHLLADRVIGQGSWGPINPRLSPWGEYLLTVARNRGKNRIHLSDAFCGLCEVRPPKASPRIFPIKTSLPSGLEGLLGSSGRQIIGLILGAGDAERRIPVSIWKALIQECVDRLPDALILLIGGKEEGEIAFALESALPTGCLNRIINMCGRTSLLALVSLLSRCQWVVGSDTGPLHLSTLCGARAVGWFFSRARVHETGPYGAGHYVWQHSQRVGLSPRETYELTGLPELPQVWPIEETVCLLSGGPVSSANGPWSLWASQYDGMGTFYQPYDGPENLQQIRQKVWDK
ncbi:MAG: glycosyltransferase family 9 protein, partial [Nitrospirales bacterium]